MSVKKPLNFKIKVIADMVGSSRALLVHVLGWEGLSLPSFFSMISGGLGSRISVFRFLETHL